jgi:hypothetical protein
MGVNKQTLNLTETERLIPPVIGPNEIIAAYCSDKRSSELTNR